MAILFYFIMFAFLGPHSWHMEIPRLPQQCQIRATFVTYITAQGNLGSLTHRVRSGIKPESSWIPVRFLTTEPQGELLNMAIFKTQNFLLFLLFTEREHMSCSWLYLYFLKVLVCPSSPFSFLSPFYCLLWHYHFYNTQHSTKCQSLRNMNLVFQYLLSFC